jgi:hypothetical protein
MMMRIARSVVVGGVAGVGIYVVGSILHILARPPK